MIPGILSKVRELRSSLKDLSSLVSENFNKLLVGKYYEPTVSKMSDEPIVLTANPLPTSWTGSGKSYTSGNYKIESSMEQYFTDANPLNNAFNGNLTDMYRASATTNKENYVKITLPEAIKVSSFKSYIPDLPGLDRVFIEGSVDGVKDWKTLYAYTGLDTGLTKHALTYTGEYKYYRILFTVDVNIGVDIIDFQMDTYSVTTARNEFYLSEFLVEPSEIEDGQRVMIKTPSHSNVGVSSNTLNSVSIDKLLEPNKYYELVYDAYSYRYVAREVI